MPPTFLALVLTPLLPLFRLGPFHLRPVPSRSNQPVKPLPSVTPPSPAGNPTPSPTARTTRSATSSRRPRPGPSSTHRFGRFQLPRPPLHTERTALFLPYPRAHRPRPFRPIWTGPNTPQTRQKSAPLHLKSFLEKTLTAREGPDSPTSTPPRQAAESTPVVSSSLARWERVGVRVFRAGRHREYPSPQPTPARRTLQFPPLTPSSPPKTAKSYARRGRKPLRGFRPRRA